MRAAGLLPLLPLLLLLLLLGVRSQDDATPGQNATTMATETTVMATSAATTKSSPTTPTANTTAETTARTTAKPNQPTVTTPTATQNITTAQSITTADQGKPPTPATVPENTPTKSGNKEPATTTATAHTSGQDSSSHSAGSPTATPTESPASSQQLGGGTASSGSSGSTNATNPVPTTGTSLPGAAGAATTTSPKQPQGNQPSDLSPNTTVSTTVTRTDPPQSSKDCVVSPPLCPTKQPPSSSNSTQGPTPSIRPGSTSVTRPVVTPSLATTGSKDKVSEAATIAAPGADQSTRDAGSASAKPTSASQRPASAQTAAPAPGQTDQTDSSSPELLPHSNLSFPNELTCEDLVCSSLVELTKPTIHLKEAKTCEKWKNESNDASFYESFCSTAQHKFDANRDGCTVKLTACKPPSRSWAVQVVLHLPLDSEEVLKYLKENDKLEELGIINITSDKMVEDMTINDEFSTPLIITIITLAVSLLLTAAIYGCYQRFSHKKDQNIHPDVPGFDDGHVALIFNQRLTEEMQTMENGYHDNPTLEVMETSSEMQEKKVNLNGELGDSWIVPLDTLMKEDLEEEDTHL